MSVSLYRKQRSFAVAFTLLIISKEQTKPCSAFPYALTGSLVHTKRNNENFT
jgi:hypothetical protein